MGDQDFVPFVEGDPGPVGFVLAQDQDKRLWWIRPSAIQKGPVVSELTPRQIDRVRAFKEILREHDTTSLDVAIDNFSRDRHPDREIQRWEIMARIYCQELAERPDADASERELLFKAVFACSFSTRLEDILSSAPQLKGFDGLTRIIKRSNEAGGGMTTDRNQHT